VCRHRGVLVLRGFQMSGQIRLKIEPQYSGMPRFVVKVMRNHRGEVTSFIGEAQTRSASGLWKRAYDVGQGLDFATVARAVSLAAARFFEKLHEHQEAIK
jgi:hypothetical protein